MKYFKTSTYVNENCKAPKIDFMDYSFEVKLQKETKKLHKI